MATFAPSGSNQRILNRSGEENRNPAVAVEVGVGPSKIIPVVAYVVSTAVQTHSCTEVNPVTINDGVRLQASISADTGRWVGGVEGGGPVSDHSFTCRIK